MMNRLLPMRPLLMCLFIAAPAQADDDLLGALRWLTGCWASVDGEPGSGEVWTAPAGGSMLGMGRTIRGGRTVTWEFVRIVGNAKGGIDYVASPAGQSTAAFELVRSSGDEVVFENPEHDFPQRVIYRRLPDDGLLGRIEGILNGENRSVDFPMKKTRCDG